MGGFAKHYGMGVYQGENPRIFERRFFLGILLLSVFGIVVAATVEVLLFCFCYYYRMLDSCELRSVREVLLLCGVAVAAAALGFLRY